MRTYILITLLALQSVAIAQIPEKPNILFVIFDDLNDWAEGWDGHPQANTPNISSLSEQGTIFLNAYSSASECAPSRTSFLTGKDCAYTQVYANSSFKCVLANNFTAETNNEEYVSLPQYLKDTAGYFTYSANKVFHCFKYGTEYDSIIEEPCDKTQSWNKRIIEDDAEFLIGLDGLYNDGVEPFRWGRIPDSLESMMDDTRTVDSVLAFWNESDTADNTCGRPWFIAVGIRKPHFPSFAPQQYFYNEYYMEDPLADPYQIPYNYPEGSTPYNGIVIPEQTSPVRFADFLTLPEEGMAAELNGSMDQIFTNYPSSVVDPPIIDETLSDSMRNIILENSQRANLVMSYLATSTYADAQFGRLMTALESRPDVYNNTVVVVIGDHGFSLGEKRHWQKGTLWEQDCRSICMIADLRNPEQHVSRHMVSFLDLFPTMCDLAGVPYPNFSDGTPYLDGLSLLPYMHSAPLNEERPVLTAIENRAVATGSCYPHHSIRNERFHLIDYTPSSGNLAEMTCALLPGEIERELYEIGTDREIDPNEFNNLANLPEYQPVIDYLLQYEPEGAMYLKQGNKVNILNKTTACFLGPTDTVRMRVRVYDTLGMMMNLTELADYTIRWTNSAYAGETFGMNYQLDLNNLPAGYFDANDRLYVYAEVTDDASGATTGFDMITMYINPENTPDADYSVLTDGNRTEIQGYSLTGSVNSVGWNFGDGYYVTDPVAAPHTYGSTGSFPLKHTLFYGNKCKKSYSEMVLIDSLVYREALPAFRLYPNPAAETVTFVTEAAGGYLEMYSLDGRMVFSSPVTESNLQIHVRDLEAGLFTLVYRYKDQVRTDKLMVLH